MHKLNTPLIGEATTVADIARCFPVMWQLRPQYMLDEFCSRVAEQMQSGYRLIYAEENGCVLAVAGFRVNTCLAWGRHLYVDDLVTDKENRGRGLGAQLLLWLKQETSRQGCAELHLDSGVQRVDAHRFYAREDLSKVAYHFAIRVSSDLALDARKER